jgi:hypothetical protein
VQQERKGEKEEDFSGVFESNIKIISQYGNLRLVLHLAVKNHTM